MTSQNKFSHLPNLCSSVLGAKVVYATDEWFAVADNLLNSNEPVWKEDEFTDYGKWMDGWESRRRRTEGYDWCIIKLEIPGEIRGIEIDTCHFTGNYSPMASVQACYIGEQSQSISRLLALREHDNSNREEGRMGLCATEEEIRLVAGLNSENWTTIVPLSTLKPGYEDTRRSHFYVESNGEKYNYLRLNMGPDGGIARLKCYGVVKPSIENIAPDEEIDLIAVENGGLAISCSNQHFGHPRNMLAPGRGDCMGDGWETARQPNRPPCYERQADGLMLLPGEDWAVIKCGIRGNIRRIVVDTNFFKGNYPESCMVEGCLINPAVNDEQEEETILQSQWRTILRRTRLTPNAIHNFSLNEDLVDVGVFSHLKLTIFPDGGVMRLRAFGTKEQQVSKL